MAVTAKWYGVPLKNTMDGTAVINYDTDDLRTSLHDADYVPNLDTDNFWDDADQDEVSGTGYTTLGFDHTTTTVTYDTGTDQIRVDADDAVWTSSSFTARIAVFYKNTGVASTSPLIIYVDFGANETVASGTFTIQWDSTGVGYIDIT